MQFGWWRDKMDQNDWLLGEAFSTLGMIFRKIPTGAIFFTAGLIKRKKEIKSNPVQIDNHPFTQ